MATPPVLLPTESHGQRSLVGYSPRGRKESDTAEVLSTYTHMKSSESTTPKKCMCDFKRPCGHLKCLK